MERDVVSFGVRLNEEGKRNGQRKKMKLKVSFIIRAAMEESVSWKPLQPTSVLIGPEMCVFQTLAFIAKLSSKENT